MLIPYAEIIQDFDFLELQVNFSWKIIYFCKCQKFLAFSKIFLKFKQIKKVSKKIKINLNRQLGSG